MDEWMQPVSEYRGEFEWNFKEGYKREGRRETVAQLLSTTAGKTSKKHAEEKNSTSTRGKKQNKNENETRKPVVLVDTNGREYDVCDTAKEAVERLIKSDPRLADKYKELVKKLDHKLQPYQTSYQSSFMKSANVFPNVEEYAVAAEEFVKNQSKFERPLKSDFRPTDNDRRHYDQWNSDVLKYGAANQTERYDGNVTDSAQEILKQTAHKDEARLKNNRRVTFADDPDGNRQKWVEKAQEELEKTYATRAKANNVDQTYRNQDLLPVWFKKSLHRQGLI